VQVGPVLFYYIIITIYAEIIIICELTERNIFFLNIHLRIYVPILPIRHAVQHVVFWTTVYYTIILYNNNGLKAKAIEHNYSL